MGKGKWGSENKGKGVREEEGKKGERKGKLGKEEN